MELRILLWKNCKAELRYLWKTIIEIVIVIISFVIIVIDPCSNAAQYGPGDFGIADKKVFESVKLDELALLNKNPHADVTTAQMSLLFTPDNEYTKKIIDGVCQTLQLKDSIGFKNEFEMESQFNDQKHLAGVVFAENFNAESKDILVISIRFPSSFRTVKPKGIRNQFWLTRCSGIIPPEEDSDLADAQIDLYIREGFLQLQQQIFMQWITTLPITTAEIIPPVTARGMFDDAFIVGCYSVEGCNLVTFLYYISFLYPFLNLVHRLGKERERNILAYHMVYGYRYWKHWFAHFLIAFLHFTIFTVLIVLIVKVPWYWGSDGTSHNDSNIFMLILFLSLYCVALIVTAMTLVCVLVSSVNSVLFGLFMWIVSYAMFTILLEPSRGLSMGWLIFSYMFFFNNACANGMRLLDDISMFTWPFYALYAGLLANVLLHLVLMWHFQHFRPGRYVQRKPYNFLKLRSLCRCMCRRKGAGKAASVVDRDPSWQNLENAPLGSEAVVRLVNVCTYHDSGRNAPHLQKISLRAFRGEIMVIYGHNGAGKTTILCTIAGFRKPESGDVIVNGYNVYDEWKTARPFIDHCMSDNALFDFLTVTETLHYFITIKMKRKKDLEKARIEKDKWLGYLGSVLPKKNMRVHKLDFNQARLLYLCCTLCCERQVILLDEPTLHMNFAERHAFYSILQQEKPNRAIILATNSTDEVEMIADRIAILNYGVLNAHGTSFFLKTQFGVGYDMIILIEPDTDVARITAILEKFFPRIKPENQIGDQLFYKLPAKGTPVFQHMLIQLEKDSAELGIQSVKVVNSELNEVYMSFGMHKYNQVLPEAEGATYDINYLEKSKLRNQQIQAMLFKNIIHQAPNIIPIVMVVVALILILVIGSMSKILAIPPSLHYHIYLGMPKTATSSSLVEKFSTAERCKFVEILNFEPGPYFKNSYAQSRTFNSESLACNTESDYPQYIAKLKSEHGQIGAAETATDLGFTAWYNQRIFHTAPISLNLAHNLIINKRSGNSQYAVIVSNDPMPIPLQSKIYLSENELAHMIFPISLGAIMPLTISAFIFQLVEERRNHILMLYKIAGLNLGVYWFTTLLWDMFTFLAYAIIFLLVLTVSSIEGLYLSSKMVIFMVLLIYAVPATALTYLLSMFFFKTEFRSFLIAVNVHLITGLALFIIFWDVFDANSIFNYIALIFPDFALLDAISNVYTETRVISFCEARCERLPNCVADNMCGVIPQCCFDSFFKFADPGILPQVFSLIISGILLILAIFLVELYRLENMFPSSKRLKQLHSATYPYDDRRVATLKKRIADNDLRDCKRAFYLVDQVESDIPKKSNYLHTISFDLLKGTCLAIYGTRNCGKTHLIKQLIGEHGFTFGDIYIRGYEFKLEPGQSYKYMGYCPQQAGLYEILSGRELLYVMAMIRGVPKGDISDIIRELSLALCLRPVINKKVRTYSFENRRKLNVAVALLLFKDVIILDEPTTGLDALTRRVIWNVLRYARYSGRSIVFTTVDSAECEALADEVIIFDHGEMFAIGSVQYLRGKFTRGFYLEVKLHRDGSTEEEAKANLRKDIENLNRFVTFLNEESEMRFQSGGLVRYYCPVRKVIYSYLYGSLEKNRRRLNIASYTVSQGSMDNVVQNIIETRSSRRRYSGP